MANYIEVPLSNFLKKVRRSVSFLKSPIVDTLTPDEVFKRGLNKSYLALGPAGCGKSESLASLCKEMGIGYKEIRLVTSTETDLMGLPYVENAPMTKEGVQKKIMMFAQNGQMPIAERDGEVGILVFDEITSCAREVQAAALQLLDVSRGVGDYKLPTKWFCVALGNGEEDGGVYRQLPPALTNRCFCYRVVSTAEAWIEWGQKAGVNPTVLAFIKQNPTSLYMLPKSSDSEYADDNTVFPSPRSWNAVSSIINNNIEFGFESDDSELREDFGAALGKDMSVRFFSFYKYGEKLMDVSTILDGTAPSDGAIFIGDGGAERRYILVQSLISNLRSNIQNDLMKQGINCDFLTKSSVTLSPEDAMEYTERLSPEVQKQIVNSLNWFANLNKITSDSDAKSARFIDVLTAFMADASRAIPEIFKITVMALDEEEVPSIDALISVYKDVVTL